MFLWWRGKERDGVPDTLPSLLQWLFGMQSTGEEELKLPMPELDPPHSPMGSPGRGSRGSSPRHTSGEILTSLGAMEAPLTSARSSLALPSVTSTEGWANRPSPPVTLTEKEQEDAIAAALASAKMEKPTEVSMAEYAQWKILEENRQVGKQITEELEELRMIAEFLAERTKAKTVAAHAQAKADAAVAKARNAKNELERLKKIKEATVKQRRELDEWRAAFETYKTEKAAIAKGQKQKTIQSKEEHRHSRRASVEEMRQKSFARRESAMNDGNASAALQSRRRASLSNIITGSMKKDKEGSPSPKQGGSVFARAGVSSASSEPQVGLPGSRGGAGPIPEAMREKYSHITGDDSGDDDPLKDAVDHSREPSFVQEDPRMEA